MALEERGDAAPDATVDALADAEAEAAAADARASAARARAAEARRKAEAQALAVDTAPATQGSGQKPHRRRRAKRTLLPAVAAALGVVLVGAFVAGSVYITAHHHGIERDGLQAAQFSAAAKQGVVNLMAINYNTAQTDVQRVLDSATGEFKENFEDTSKDLVKALQDVKVVTQVNVKEVAVESMTPGSAVVLVSAVTQRGNADSKDRDPRTWRALVTVTRDGDQLKIAQLDFV
jgi:Mce-associated membrane protein